MKTLIVGVAAAGSAIVALAQPQTVYVKPVHVPDIAAPILDTSEVQKPRALIKITENHRGVDKMMQRTMDDSCGLSLSCTEGYGYIMPQQAFVYSAVSRGASTVCETGFNAGVSAAAFLEADPNVHVISFDLMKSAWSIASFEKLTARYGERLEIVVGDSKTGIPWYINQNPDVRCDVIHIDGDHSYEGAYSDLVQLQEIASPQGAVLLMDDTAFDGPKRAYDQAIAEGRIKELSCFSPGLVRQWEEGLLSAVYPQPIPRGFCVAAYVPGWTPQGARRQEL